MGLPGGPELLVILFVILLIFGGRKLPELAQGLGKGIREFKKATREDTPQNSEGEETNKPEK